MNFLKLSIKLIKILPFFIIIALSVSPYKSISVFAKEQPEKVFVGSKETDVVLNNLVYEDVISSGTWAAEAIYETGALGIFKGYGGKSFGLKDTISKEQAIAIALRAGGKEADAQIAAEQIDVQKRQANKQSEPLSFWSQGYLKIASDDGLITQTDYRNAANIDQSKLLPGSFYKGAPAQRQEMAFYIAKALKLEPVYNEQNIFNNYKDWKSADPSKIPYIEAVLRNNIMNGDDNGSFNPTGNLTREQAAQIIKNAANLIYPSLKSQKLIGSIEDVIISRQLNGSIPSQILGFQIRNLNGKLHNINVGYEEKVSNPNKNEVTGNEIYNYINDIVVYKNGVISNSSVLRVGDRIEYIVNDAGIVRYIKVFSNIKDTSYLVAQINSIDETNSTMNVVPFFNIQTYDLEATKKYIDYNPDNIKNFDSYIYSNDVKIINDKFIAPISILKKDTGVLLTIVNGIIKSVDVISVKYKEENGIVTGTVEENNPELGYISLYSHYGKGFLSPNPEQYLRIYYYNKGEIESFKNHLASTIDSIKEGDSVFLKLDEDNYVKSVSGVSNYTVKDAKVISKNGDELAVQYKDGTQQILKIDTNTVVMKNNTPVSADSIKDGEELKVALNIGKSVVLDRIIMKNNLLVSKIYKAIVAGVDTIPGKVTLENTEYLDRDKWIRGDIKGAINIKKAEDLSVYYDDNIVGIDKVKKTLLGKQAYIAVRNDYGNEENIIMISFSNEKDAEIPSIFSDNVSNAGRDAQHIMLSKENKPLKYGLGTVIVKDGKLLLGSNIKPDDNIYVVARQAYANGELKAGVINIENKATISNLKIYRGRILNINEDKDLTVESYSEIKDMKTEFYNTPKTFSLTYNTRLFGDKGLLSTRELKDFGTNSFAGKSIYIVSKDSEAVLISTAPLTNAAYIAGQIYEINQGTALTIKLNDSRIYNANNYLWSMSSDITLNILPNTIIIRGNEILKASQLKSGDKIKALKKENTTTGDAYVIYLEN